MGSGEVGPPFTKLCVAKTTISPLQNLSLSFPLSPLNGIPNSEMYTKAHTFGTRLCWSPTLSPFLSNNCVMYQGLLWNSSLKIYCDFLVLIYLLGDPPGFAWEIKSKIIHLFGIMECFKSRSPFLGLWNWDTI